MPSPVAQIELPELDVTEEDMEASKSLFIPSNLMPDNLLDIAAWWLKMLRWMGGARHRREIQLLDALTQLSALREASEWVEISKNGFPPEGEVVFASDGESVERGFIYDDGTFDTAISHPTLEPTHWRRTVLPPQPASAGKDK